MEGDLVAASLISSWIMQAGMRQSILIVRSLPELVERMTLPFLLFLIRKQGCLMVCLISIALRMNWLEAQRLLDGSSGRVGVLLRSGSTIVSISFDSCFIKQLTCPHHDGVRAYGEKDRIRGRVG